MNEHTDKPDYGPSAYDLSYDFDFDLELNFFDYLLLTLYLVTVFPFVLLTRFFKRTYQLFSRKTKNQTNKQSLVRLPSAAFSMISKLF